ncbi:MAG: tRNA (adenosine(37)-N6)-threonylcarbamoyltransferase complex ATPase subunit type 1 TsaE [Flaviflexus sp.]|nr:tRNA (adenosine(37)-N6)-threonylcarbamoyltransferase complex ATPase subunit type 1 TsaE [Flaviflexus sp.]
MRIDSSDAMRALGERLAQYVSAGDLITLSGELGAGKTTLVQGLARGMNVAGRVTSPTFVIAHVHEGEVDLVHVDAYRLERIEDVDALDLDASLDDSVTIIEWGAGKTDSLSADRLLIDIVRPTGSAGLEPVDLAGDEPREVTISGTGKRSRAIAEALA